jgi:rare lipoprotein A
MKVALFGALLLCACALGQAGCEMQGRSRQRGVASWYGEPQITASGERYSPSALTAAHRTLPFGTMVKVTNLATNRAAVVRINDRGPYHGGRLIDLSKAAAEQLHMKRSGTAKVEVEVIGLAER